MPTECLNCRDAEIGGSKYILWGSFYRRGDSRLVQRYRCTGCRKTCSKATFHYWFRQKKRRKNLLLKRHFASGGTIRRASLIFKLNRKTVERKLELLGFIAEIEMRRSNLSLPKATAVPAATGPVTPTFGANSGAEVIRIATTNQVGRPIRMQRR